MSNRHAAAALAGALLLVLAGCSASGAQSSPSSSAQPAAVGRYPDGIPRVLAGAPVLRGPAALAAAKARTDAAPFLLGGWMTLLPTLYACPLMPSDDAWFTPCGQPGFSDVAGDAGDALVASGALTFHFAPLNGRHSGAAILRVHVHDPRAAECGDRQAACAQAMVVEEITWNGDEFTAPHPLDAGTVGPALASVQPGAILTPVSERVVFTDCGGVLPASLHYVVAAGERQVPAVLEVAVAPSVEALARALPIPEGLPGTLDPAALVSTGSGTSPEGSWSYACRWLRVANVALLVRTAVPRPSPADQAFLENLAAALGARVH
jgi:hypothetical protein